MMGRVEAYVRKASRPGSIAGAGAGLLMEAGATLWGYIDWSGHTNVEMFDWDLPRQLPGT